MYLSTRSVAAAGRPLGDGVPARPEPEPAQDRRTGRESNVWFLGLTSMFTDVSAEMVAAVVPLFLTLQLGLGPLGLGLFDGAYQAFGALAAVAAAVGADRGRRHKLTAGLGYALSAVCTLGLTAARAGWATAVALLYLTRLGKGIRTAPRDALISLSVAPGRLGRAFGVHRAFDTVGAVAGPVAASLLLARDPSGYGTVFTVGFLVAVVGLATFVLFVQETDGDERGGAAAGGSGGPRHLAGAALGMRPFRLVVAMGTGLALVRPGESLLYLAFVREAGVTTAQFPLLFSAASVTFLLAAAPLGVLADRIGLRRVFVLGALAVACSLAVVASGLRGTGALVLLLALVGVSYAATDGVLVALAAGALPARWRTTGLAVLATAVAAGRFGASAIFGALYEHVGSSAAARVFLVGAAAVAAMTVVVARREEMVP
jgi:MFS family permease